MDIKRAKEISNYFGEKVRKKQFKENVKEINKTIKRNCKNGEFSCTRYVRDINPSVRKQLVDHYKDKGFDAELIYGNCIKIIWE